jgi:hypothetical protein
MKVGYGISLDGFDYIVLFILRQAEALFTTIRYFSLKNDRKMSSPSLARVKGLL